MPKEKNKVEIQNFPNAMWECPKYQTTNYSILVTTSINIPNRSSVCLLPNILEQASNSEEIEDFEIFISKIRIKYKLFFYIETNQVSCDISCSNNYLI